MREADRLEVEASSGNIHDTLYKSIHISKRSLAVSVEGKLLYIIGIVKPTLLSDKGIPWLLGTNEIKRHKKVFMRSTYELLKETMAECRELENYVDARNTDSIKWLKFMGFTLDEPIPFGKEKKPFHRFYWSKY